MQSPSNIRIKNFTPKVNYKCFCFVPLCWPYYCEMLRQDPEEVTKTMEKWIHDQQNKITIVRIERYDFETEYLHIPKAHYKVLYVEKNNFC